MSKIKEKMIQEFKEKMIKWEEKFNFYLLIETKCIEFISSMGEIKNKLTTLIGNQRTDDIIFYKSIINSSYYYFNESLKVRKLKYIKDLTYIWKKIDDKKSIVELNNSSFSSLLKDFSKLFEDIAIAKQYNTPLSWVKDDKVISVKEIEEELTDILAYHLNIISFFHTSIKNECEFYCSHKKI